MGPQYTVVVGEGGRVTVPADVRSRHRLVEGASLALIDTGEGLVLMTREQLHGRVRGQLEGHDLVADLIADRRRAAAAEGADPECGPFHARTGAGDGTLR